MHNRNLQGPISGDNSLEQSGNSVDNHTHGNGGSTMDGSLDGSDSESDSSTSLEGSPRCDKENRITSVKQLKGTLTQKVAKKAFPLMCAYYITEDVFPDDYLETQFAIDSFSDAWNEEHDKGVNMQGVAEKPSEEIFQLVSST